MERRIGFIDLDNYFKEFGQKNNWNFGDLVNKGFIEKHGYANGHYWLTVNNKKYYFKYTAYPYNELVCYEIAKFLGIKAIKYDLAFFVGTYGVISEDYKKDDCKYTSGSIILEEYIKDNKESILKMFSKNEEAKLVKEPFLIPLNNLEIIWQALENKYPNSNDNNMRDCIHNLVQQFLFMILTNQYDKAPYNWEIEENENKINIVPIFDNEASFPEDEYEAAMSTGTEDIAKNNLIILERFLEVSSDEYIELFLEYFNKLTEEKFLELLNKIELNIEEEIFFHAKAELIKNFNMHRRNIQIVLDNLKISNNKGRN